MGRDEGLARTAPATAGEGPPRCSTAARLGQGEVVHQFGRADADAPAVARRGVGGRGIFGGRRRGAVRPRRHGRRLGSRPGRCRHGTEQLRVLGALRRHTHSHSMVPGGFDGHPGPAQRVNAYRRIGYELKWNLDWIDRRGEFNALLGNTAADLATRLEKAGWLPI